MASGAADTHCSKSAGNIPVWQAISGFLMRSKLGFSAFASKGKQRSLLPDLDSRAMRDIGFTTTGHDIPGLSITAEMQRKNQIEVHTLMR